MVGTRRSTGCETCRKRKKKCGEELPECAACRKSGWKCPGYSRRWKFVDENSQLISLYRRKKYIFDDVDESRGPDWKQPEYVSYGPVSPEKEIPAPNPGYKPIIQCHLSTPSDQTCAALCYMLDRPESQTRFPVRSFGGFLEMIPSRLGRNVALDDSISCICSIYTDAPRCAPGTTTSLKLYARSLNSLRKSLGSPQARTESETICASIILQICELNLSDDMGRWDSLCRGSKLLIQQCGPTRFSEPFERSMLESQRAWFIVQDVDSERQCFLSHKHWRDLLETSRRLDVGKEPRGFSLRAELCEFLVEVPSLIAEVSYVSKHMDANDITSVDFANRHQKALLRTLALKRSLESWYSAKLEPQRPSPIFQSNDQQLVRADGAVTRMPGDQPKFAYPELLSAVADCVSNSLMVRLGMLLSSMLSISPYQRDRVDLYPCLGVMLRRRDAASQSLDIVRSISHVAAKPLDFGLRQLWANGTGNLDSVIEIGGRLQAPS
ncbi:hypothetical protein A1O3_05643 [Capronia epimyces CBS 606.96]|uniref:Zn(2)-C6 fungal-type domain-containing protein n=1 Tax=Capronia epimyces CBS 606.96 TaxID=1182542 RepID=W9XXL9_9EURO|nr:uncharacterized protein A1O3_05643 [Capronia epimyces CBS 606.96]EXJ84968.1 hypothetical protein A1O3_05643 [Capronia epimyces CBS 606.96]